MKYFFHIFFTGALLLGSLIIFNARENECAACLTDIPDIEGVELLAELCSSQTAASSVFSNRHMPVIKLKANPGSLNHPEDLNTAEHQVRLKTQMLIHLELKPGIGFQSSVNIHQLSGNDDPPVA